MALDWQNNTAVYTCVTNGFDHQRSQVMIPGVDYYYFTDGINNPHPSIGWKVVLIPDDFMPNLDHRRRAKIFKVYPFLVETLQKYKYTIWIDGSMQIVSKSFVPEVISFLNNGLVISPHFDGRHCAYGEAIIRPKKYASEPLDEQVAFYRQEGFPAEYGLYECGIIARDMTNLKVRDLCEIWLNQNMDWSYQDQVSLPYVLWKTGFTPDVLPKSFRFMNWIIINAHKTED